MNRNIKLLFFYYLVLILFNSSCLALQSKKSTYSFIHVWTSYFIDKKGVQHVSREKYFDEKSFFGTSRYGNFREIKHTISKPIKCRKGTIVELGSCTEVINCKTKLWMFDINYDEHYSLFIDSLNNDYSKFKMNKGEYTFKIDKSEQILIIIEYDTTQKILTQTYINGYNCFVSETAIKDKYNEKKSTTYYSANIETADLREYSFPIYYIWKQNYGKIENITRID